MTIAAGFKSADSVILCADQEYTYPTLKLPGRKIFPLNVPNREMNLAIATAGTINTGRSAFQFIKNALLSLPSGVFDETSLQVFLEDQLWKFHDKQIFKHPRYRYPDGPRVDLVIAAQFKNASAVSLFASEETVVNIEHPFCFAGNGEEIARYIVEPLVMTQLQTRPTREVLLLATHMLRQVQTSAGNCGQGAAFFRLSNDGDFHDVMNFPLPKIEAYSETFQRMVESLFYAGADLDLDDQIVKFSLQLTDKTIKAIRDEQRDEKRRRAELEQQLFGKAKN